MPAGILAYPDDGGPAIELTANSVRCPSYVATNVFPRPDSTDNKITRNFPISTYPGATTFTIPDTTAHVGSPISPNLLAAVHFMTELSSDGSNVHCKWEGNYVARQWTPTLCTLRTYQILPAETQGFVGADGRHYGILLNDSTNFLAITDAAMVGQCVWKGAITTPWSAPAISGFDPSRYLVFAHWDHPTYTLDYDPNSHTLRAYQPREAGFATEVNMSVEVVIFCDGVPPQPHYGGISIFNAQNQCTFSTAKAPFLLKGFINSTGGSAPGGVARMMVPVTRVGVHLTELKGSHGWYYYSYMGMRMSGNVLSYGQTMGMKDDTNQYGSVLGGSKVFTYPIPVIDSANFM